MTLIFLIIALPLFSYAIMIVGAISLITGITIHYFKKKGKINAKKKD